MHAGLASWQITISRDDITFFIAFLGAGLGVFNLWLTWKRGRVSLKVVPKSFFQFGEDDLPNPFYFHTNAKGEKLPKYLCIDIKNTGIAVWVNEVGFLIKGSKERFVLMKQFPPYKKMLPVRLEPHSSVTIYADELAPETFELAAKFKCAYADVASGKRFKGKSRTLKELRKFAEGRQAELDRNDSAS